MAWQTPKTDWSVADGVRDTDLNRIEGNILELYNSGMAQVNFELFVDTSGNDTTGDGTSAAPYATITKALSMIPKNLNGKIAVIEVAAGTYNESVTIKGFTGTVVLAGAYSSRATVNGLTIDACHCLLDTLRIDISTSTGVNVINGGLLTGTGILGVSGSASVSVTGCSGVSLNAIECTNVNGYALFVDTASRLNAGTIDGTGSTNGMLVQGGSIVSFAFNNMTVTGTMYMTYAGGRIYSGAQYSTPEF